MSRLTGKIVKKLIREGVIPSEHRLLAMEALEREMRRRSRWVVRGLARETVGVQALLHAS